MGNHTALSYNKRREARRLCLYPVWSVDSSSIGGKCFAVKPYVKIFMQKVTTVSHVERVTVDQCQVRENMTSRV